MGHPGAAPDLREPAFHGHTRWGMAVCSHFSSSEENSVPPLGLPPQARRVVRHPDLVLVGSWLLAPITGAVFRLELVTPGLLNEKAVLWVDLDM